MPGVIIRAAVCELLFAVQIESEFVVVLLRAVRVIEREDRRRVIGRHVDVCYDVGSGVGDARVAAEDVIRVSSGGLFEPEGIAALPVQLPDRAVFAVFGESEEIPAHIGVRRVTDMPYLDAVLADVLAAVLCIFPFEVIAAGLAAGECVLHPSGSIASAALAGKPVEHGSRRAVLYAVKVELIVIGLRLEPIIEAERFVLGHIEGLRAEKRGGACAARSSGLRAGIRIVVDRGHVRKTVIEERARIAGGVVDAGLHAEILFARNGFFCLLFPAPRGVFKIGSRYRGRVFELLGGTVPGNDCLLFRKVLFGLRQDGNGYERGRHQYGERQC